ncbi:MAG TPA: hypothetical protein VJK53_00490 [Candidatus Paceibacterota bacterium]
MRKFMGQKRYWTTEGAGLWRESTAADFAALRRKAGVIPLPEREVHLSGFTYNEGVFQGIVTEGKILEATWEHNEAFLQAVRKASKKC